MFVFFNTAPDQNEECSQIAEKSDNRGNKHNNTINLSRIDNSIDGLDNKPD